MSDPKPCPLCGCPFGGVSEEKPDRHDIDRAALVEVARRTSIYVDHFDHEYDGQEQEIAQVAEARAKFIVAEYLAEQAGKDDECPTSRATRSRARSAGRRQRRTTPQNVTDLALRQR